MSITPAPMANYSSVLEWMKITIALSKNGERIISSFDQVPPDLIPIFHNIVSNVALSLKVLDTEGRINCRNIVNEHAPKLLPNFDHQFGSLFEQ